MRQISDRAPSFADTKILLHPGAHSPMGGASLLRPQCDRVSTRSKLSRTRTVTRAAAMDPPPRRDGVSKAAVGQMTATNDLDANFQTCSTLAKEASSQGCSILFLPECFAYIGIAGTDALAVMEPLDGPLMGRYRALAKDTGVWLSLGGFAETGPDADHRYNTHVLLDSDGEIRASYRKIHLFDVDIPNGPLLMESKTAAPGESIVAAESPVGRLGMTVCYDLRFPELYSRLRHEMGAQVMLVPSAFTKPTGEAHWEVLLRARAIETQSYVVAAAQCGVHSDKRESYGHAIIIDPWGKVVAKLEDPDNGIGIATADIDLGYLEDVRGRIPVDKHRRALTTFPASVKK